MILDIKIGVNYLMFGKVDVVVGDELVLWYYINNYGFLNKYSVLSNFIYIKKVVFVVFK